MFQIFSASQCRKMDERTIRDIGIPGIVLMENAAIGIFRELMDKGESFLILCGKGNNGGDALALCRHLIEEKKRVKVYVVSADENYSVDFNINFNIIKQLIDGDKIVFIKSENDINDNIIYDLKKYDVVVDGLFGVGLNKDLPEMFTKIVQYVNLYAGFTVSIDVPSGLDCDLGTERGVAIQADITYTFEVIKRGFLNYKASNYVGKVKILKIGIPEHVKRNNSSNLCILEKKEYANMYPRREVYGHKGNYGRALVVAGRMGFTGAAYITTECTIRAGAGLTTLICSEDVQKALGNKFIEAMMLNWNNSDVLGLMKKANSIAFGPGIGIGEQEKALLEMVINNSKCKLIIDADGITLLGKNKYLMDKLKGRTIITPHPGEMARFLGITVEEVESDRINITKEVAKKYEVVVLLKGYNTVISDGKDTYINPTGNSKMASGGMGDALTGIINAFLSQGTNLIEAALIGAYVHGSIADRLGEQVYIVNARDIINELPKEINSIIT